jgi:hypothetical protein
VSELDGTRHATAVGHAHDVGGGRVQSVVDVLGAPFRQPAVDSFLHGYQLAVGIAAACTAVAAGLAWTGFRQRAERQQAATQPDPAVQKREATVTGDRSPRRSK